MHTKISILLAQFGLYDHNQTEFSFLRNYGTSSTTLISTSAPQRTQIPTTSNGTHYDSQMRPKSETPLQPRLLDPFEPTIQGLEI